MKCYKITVPLEIHQYFDDDETDMEYIKESLGLQLDDLMQSTDFVGDYWKTAKVEEC